VRDEAMQAMGSNMLEVIEFDPVIAHLHVPELV
jgi:hypothetical protein